MDTIFSYPIKAVGDLFLIFGIGFPSALLFMRQDSRYYLLRLILGSAVFSGLFIYLVFVITTNFSTLKLPEFQIVFAIIFIVPFAVPKMRSNLKGLYQKFRRPERHLGLFEITILAIVISVILTIFVIAVQSTPILDDPLTVWLFLGKKIFLTGKRPLFFGNAADVSESGNYPPMAPFLAASSFFLFNNLNPSNYSMIPFYYGVLSILAVVLLVKELGGKTESALIAALVLLVTSIFSLEMLGYGYTDTLDSFYVIAFLAFVFSKSEFRTESAVFSLLALADGIESKYDVLLVIIPSSILFLYLRRDFFIAEKTRIFFVGRVLFLLGILSIMGSWFIRNWRLVGDPIYPFLYTIFKARGIVPSVKGLVPPSSYPIPPFSPLFILYDRTLFALSNEGDLWPLLVLGLGGAIFFLTRKKEKSLRVLSLWSMTSFVFVLAFWETQGGFERYFLIVVPSLAALSGFFFDKLTHIWDSRSDAPSNTAIRDRRSTILRFVILIFIIVLSLTSLVAVFIQAQPTYQNTALVQSWNYVNNLPQGLVATNDIRLFYANQSIISFYNVPGFFNATDSYSEYLDLKASNIAYIYFDSRFDITVYESHSYLMKLLESTVYVTPINKFQLGSSESVTVYKVD